MKKILLTLFLFSHLITFSQEKYSLPPCGTPAQWQNTDYSDLDFSRSGGDTILYVPITLFQMGNKDGGFFSTTKVLDAFNHLNESFLPAKIQWFMEGDIRFVKNTLWNNHKTIVEGWDMMSKNNVKNTINCYVCTSAAGNCGYNTPYGGVALARACMGALDNTWAHELGHALRLPHPFLGWEGKTYNPNLPTPTKVTYDYSEFKDTLIPGLKIIDTAYVEFVNKANCKIAADQICDTKPDYISIRWSCDATKQSPGTYKDPNGDTFKSDGTLYMSYSLDECQTRFSEDEMAVMRATLKGKKQNLLYNQIPKPKVDSKAVLVLPADKGQVDTSNVFLQWEKVPNVTKYVVELSRISSLTSAEAEYITDKTELKVSKLLPNKTYYWRVRPYNTHSGGVNSDKRSFFTAIISDVKNITSISEAVLFPNPISEGEATLRFTNSSDLKGQLQLNDFTGKTIFTQKLNLPTGAQSLPIPTSNLAKGMYFVVIFDEKGGVLSKKLIKE